MSLHSFYKRIVFWASFCKKIKQSPAAAGDGAVSSGQLAGLNAHHIPCVKDALIGVRACTPACRETNMQNAISATSE
jgi:hypothetical protein